MKRKNILYFGMGIIYVAISIWQIAAAQSGLKIIHLPATNPPVTIILPAGIQPASRPTVLIAHGFAGSSVLMRGFALTLAHAGYITVSWDFEGNGSNPNPFGQSFQSAGLLHDAESALAEAASTGLVDTQRVAILGHSMGSGVAIAYGMAHPETQATIAISPFSQTASPSLPHNLLIMAGGFEAQVRMQAEQLLATAGGEGGYLANGSARQIAIIPNVEHISILFSPTAQTLARHWLDGTFGVQAGASDTIDHRIIWYGLGIAGFIFVGVAGINSLPRLKEVQVSPRPLWRRLIALLGGGIGATLILWLVSLVGVNISQLLGLLVGGYIILWYCLAGIISLLILRPQITRPTSTNLVKGLIAFIALWLGVGLLGNFVWLPWLLIPARLQLWVPASMLAFPWFFAVGEAAKSSGRSAGQVGWWLAQVLVMVGGLVLAFILTPGLFFIILILPVIPIMLGLGSLILTPRHGSWSFALSGALFTAWLLLAVFPIR